MASNDENKPVEAQAETMSTSAAAPAIVNPFSNPFGRPSVNVNPFGAPSGNQFGAPSVNPFRSPSINPFASTSHPIDPNKKCRKLSAAELEMALIEIVIECEWDNTKKKMKEATTAAQRSKIRRKHMHAIMRSTETADTQETQEVLDGRIRLLEWDDELAVFEEKYWFERM